MECQRDGYGEGGGMRSRGMLCRELVEERKRGRGGEEAQGRKNKNNTGGRANEEEKIN